MKEWVITEGDLQDFAKKKPTAGFEDCHELAKRLYYCTVKERAALARALEDVAQGPHAVRRAHHWWKGIPLPS